MTKKEKDQRLRDLGSYKKFIKAVENDYERGGLWIKLKKVFYLGKISQNKFIPLFLKYNPR